ncbi:MAG: hypothetical protein AAGJ37_02010 [Pseudomonadota bacterium]
MPLFYSVIVLGFFTLNLFTTPLAWASNIEDVTLQLVHQKNKIKVKEGKYKLVARILEATSNDHCAFMGETHVDVKYKYRRKDQNMVLVTEKSQDGYAYETLSHTLLDTHRGREIVSFDALDCTPFVRIRFMQQVEVN